MAGTETERWADDWLLERQHLVSVQEYHRMAEAGVFGSAPRLELLEGVIVEAMTKNPPHNLATDLLQYLLVERLPAGYFATMGTSLTIAAADSEPEPDGMVLRGRPRDYAGRRRRPEDVALVVEVADASYEDDRRVKARIYAGAGVPIYWIVDLNRRRMEILTLPRGTGGAACYGVERVLEAGQEAELVLDGSPVARFQVAELLP